ncbi:hypothetical protein N7510_001027 [Penicillium lagena]|uniref:uncharacterized protein n=1 Tax=Penicillium lagena TaxID=94218 RepID=UPI002541FF6C|nr:uncharacterized protein N7510_001027 [Penicillium lagena]KAJ5624718.1 hypothetical protein N7510_001027 [Penicillium lagena]
MARHGKTKARAKRAPRPDPGPSPPRLTMQQEARNTETHHQWWTTSLRHKAVQFVSAGDLEPSDELKDLNQIAQTDQAKSETERRETEGEPEPPTDDSTPIFFIDRTGQNIEDTGFSVPEPLLDRSDLDTSSEDEVTTGDELQEFLDTFADRPLTSATPRKETAHADQTPDTHPTSHAEPKPNQLWKLYSQQEEDMIADYIANMDSDYCDEDTHSTLPEIEGGITVDKATTQQDLSMQVPTEPPGNPNTQTESESKSESEVHVQSSIDGKPQKTTWTERVTSDSDIEKLVLANMHLDPDLASTVVSDEDEETADELEESDLNEDDDMDTVDIDMLQEQLDRYTRAQRKKHGFVSATAFADALESDPYYGLDIMDFNRPSLRKKSKGKKPLFDLDISDSELEFELEQAWENDRRTKKMKKKEREQLRAEGLLGRSTKSPDLKAKYPKDMNMEELITEMRAFLLSPKSSLSLPPMNKQRRKMVHELAHVVSLKSQSKGNGQARCPILVKTSRTPGYTRKTISKVDELLSGRKLNRRLFKSWGQDSSKPSKAKRGGASSGPGVSYVDGDVVGGSAPEIGAENRGRAMLEKMGWSTGTALGATNNKGILLPVAQVVKNTRAGLG